ncbi:MAG: large repetitive protein, partial [Bacillota bacterium]|nr:large repetitive protein [Bacillota bacterium]
TIQMSGLSEGSHTLSLNLSDNAGNPATQQTLNFNVDWNPPTKPGMPSPASSPTTDTTPVWTWAGSEDEISGVDYYQIQIRRSGSSDWDVLDTPLDIVDNLTPGDQTWEQALPLESGSYVIRVRAWDVAGNYSEWSDEGTVEVDVNPVAAPAIAALYEGYNTSPIPIDWNDVVDGSNAISYVLEWADNAGFAGATSVPLGVSEYSFDAAAAGEGTYWFRVKTISTVNAGPPAQTKESGWSAVVSTTYDVTGPEAPQMLALPEYTDDDSVTFIWSAVTDAVGYDFSYSLDGGASWSAVTGLTVQTYTVDIGAASDGDVIQGKVVAYDAAGNASAESNVVSTTVDRTGPVVTAGPAPVSPTSNPRPTWTWSGDDGSGSGVKGYWVTLDAEAPIWTTGTSFTPSSDLADGDHVVKVKGVDNLDNVGSEISLGTVTVDTAPPDVPGMPQTTSPTNDTMPTWTWGAVSGAASYNVYLDDAFVGNQAGTSYTPSADLSDGQHYLQVSALDDLNNESAKSEAGYVVIDTTGPEIKLLSPLEGNITTASTVLIELSDGPNGSGVDGESAQLQIDEKGDWVTPTAIVGDILYYVMDLSLLSGADEWHTLEVKVEDNAHNLSSQKWLFKLELYREGFGFGRLRFPEESD